MKKLRFQSVLLAIMLAACPGCLPSLPENAKPADPPDRTILMDVPNGRVQTELGVNDAVWLEVDRPDGRGPIGGYLSQNDSPKKALVVLLHGASTFSLTGAIGSALMFQQSLGSSLQSRGYVTWSLAYPECGTPYGQDDLQAVVDALDWLDRIGQSTFGFHRVYLAGYSTGGTLSVLANRQRTLSAVASISGLTGPRSIEDLWGLFDWLTGIYPQNLAACQMRQTLDFYGAPGSPNWNYLDTVSHINELRSPMILVHGKDDPLFSVDNARNLEDRYNLGIAQGESIPEMGFVYLRYVSHFPDVTRPEVVNPIVDFFDAHNEPHLSSP